MKKISQLPITEDAADMYIDGIKPDGLDGQGNPKYKNYRVPASAIGGGGGEVWEDITNRLDCTMDTSINRFFVLAGGTGILRLLIKQSPYNPFIPENVGFIVEHIYIRDDGGVAMAYKYSPLVLTNNNPTEVEGLMGYASSIGVSDFPADANISLEFGTTIEDEDYRPEIVKVERLVQS